MFDSQRGGRRPTYRYDKTDLILLGGGGLFVIVGAALAIGAWLDPSARRASAMVPTRSAGITAAPDSARPPRTGLLASHDSAATRAVAAQTAPVVSTVKDSVARRAPVTAPVPVVAGPVPAPKPIATAAAPTVATPRAAVAAGATVTKPTTTAAPDVPGQFLVQLGSFGQQENAERLAARARGLGFTVSVIPAGTMHRVLISGFPTRPAAIAVRDSLAHTLDISPKILP